jgi:hypothetical protein
MTLFPSAVAFPSRRGLNIKRYALCALLAMPAWGAQPAHAQVKFDSGSTGADGAFAPTSNQTIQVPESGVFNFTAVNIPFPITITFTRNARNTPVTILASGDVNIAGSINVAGQDGNANNGYGGEGGPGGFKGGNGGYRFAPFAGTNGDGPGGGEGGGSDDGANAGSGGSGGYATEGRTGAPGTARHGKGGQPYGSPTLLPLLGGSGGGGGAGSPTQNGGAGGGGGGAILIASSATLRLSGGIAAYGGSSVNFQAAGGAGSGGAIRLVANTMAGTGALDVRGGGNGIPGSPGYIRVEAYDYRDFNPASVGGIPISFAQPNPVSVPNGPSLRIASVAAIPTPASTQGALQGAPDLVLPSSQPSPVELVIEASNIPLGTVVRVAVTPVIGPRAVYQSSPLTGTTAASSATASVPLPSGKSVITASAVIDLTTADANPMISTNERAAQMEVVTSYGGNSSLTYTTPSGQRRASAQ